MAGPPAQVGAGGDGSAVRGEAVADTDAIDLNAIANPTNESTETLSAPTALFQSDPSTIDSFLSEQCIHPAIANGREKRKSVQNVV